MAEKCEGALLCVQDLNVVYLVGQKPLGANRDGAHHTGAHDGLDADGTSRDVDAGALALERCAELEGEILELRRRASAAKRAGDSVTAREFLKAALAAREELRETRAFAEDEADG